MYVVQSHFVVKLSEPRLSNSNERQRVITSLPEIIISGKYYVSLSLIAKHLLMYLVPTHDAYRQCLQNKP